MVVPSMKVRATGASIPAIGLGTFGSDHASAAVVAQAVETALKVGYRHIDCAAVYGNEREIGEVLRRAIAGEIEGLPPVPRDELWITSKLWNDKHAKGDCIEAFMQSLGDLGLDYLDLYLVHWPFPNSHDAHCTVESRSKSARPYIHEEFMELWHELEGLVDRGLVRHLGVSNMTRPKLELVLRDARIKPSFNEMELHPSFQQKELFNYVKSTGMQIIGYCPLGSPNRPARDMTSDDVVDMELPSIVSAAKAHGCHPASICIKWAFQNGHIPIPFSTKERNIASNLESICSDPLSDAEMAAIAADDRGCRLVKGQVFLWDGCGDDWHKLWDEKGCIEK